MTKKIFFERFICACGIFGLFLITQAVTFAIHSLWPERTVLNKGVIFGLFSNPILVAGIILIGLMLLWQAILFEQRSAYHQLAIILIATGAFSNIFDRFVYGGVVDYLYFSHWTTYNLADLEIILGIIMLI